MRQGQQNRRGRGRNNNQNNQQRKGQNPLTRSFESNGPDVKLRGTPAHIAEKYMSLARDAQSSGDPVLAENYLQHAEHYNRIIMAFREQQVGQGGDPGYNGGLNGQHSADGNFSSGQEGDEAFEGSGEQPALPRHGGSEQPRVYEGGGNERRFDDRPHRMHGEQRYQNQGPRDRDLDRDRDRSFQGERGGFDRRDRPDRPDRHERQDRFDRPDRDRSDRPDRTEHRMDRERPERPQQPAPEQRTSEPRAEGGLPQRRRDRPMGDRLPAEAHEQPEFLRRPVRRPRRDDQDEAVAAAPAPAVTASEDSD
jgi:hypothetical protein